MLAEHYQFTLALFTLLAPAGAVALVVMALPVMMQRGGDCVDGASTETLAYHRISRFLIVPLAVAMVGLIASATHLGTPSNALYVLMGWGRSPLSNEVVAALAFLVLAGVYWLSSFRVVLPLRYARFALGLTSAASLILVWKISIVYAIRTIPTWNTDAVVLGLWCTALCGGVALGIVGLVASGVPVSRRYLLLLCGAGIVSLVGATATFAYQGAQLPSIGNWTGNAAQLAPCYGLEIVAFTVLGAIGWATTLWQVHRARGSTPSLAVCCVGAAFAFAGIYVMRVVFYGLHMTGGFL